MMVQQDDSFEEIGGNRPDACSLAPSKHPAAVLASSSTTSSTASFSRTSLTLPPIASPLMGRKHEGHASSTAKESPRAQRAQRLRGISMPVPASIPSPRSRSPTLHAPISPSAQASYLSHGALSHEELAHLKQAANNATSPTPPRESAKIVHTPRKLVRVVSLYLALI